MLMLGQITLPDVAPDLTDYITALGVLLGGFVASAVGLVFAFRAVRAGMKWIRMI